MACVSSFPVSPIFFWRQTLDTVSFYIILDKLRKTRAVFSEKNFLFEATNEKGNKNFKVEFELFDDWSDIYRLQLTSTKTFFRIIKETSVMWPRLLLTEEKSPCLIVDLDKWYDILNDEEDSESDDDDEEDDPFKQPMTTKTAEILENFIVHKKEFLFKTV